MIALIALMFFSMYRLNPNVQRPKELTQIEFFKKVDDGKIVEPIVRYLDRDEGETYLTGEVETDELDKDGNPVRETYRVSLVPGENEGLMNDLFNAQMKVVVKEKKSLMSPFVAQLVFFLGFMALFYFLFYRKMGGGGGLFGFGKSRAKVLDGKEEKKNRISFASVAGIDEAKEEVQEIVEFLKDPASFQKLGGRIPKGILLVGPPGTGKTMLAKRLPSILPPLTLNEALETTKIHSVAGKMSRYASLIAVRPFRSPHHTISDVALVGGGTSPQPGEISLAHNGVLFLDELPEFKRQVLEVMRQPLEDRCVTISRSQYTVEFPASFMFVAAMNPCPCGNYNHPTIVCTCKPGEVQNYLGKVSGPLMDRIDLHVEVVPVSHEELASNKPVEKSAEIRKRVVAAREIQKERFQNSIDIFCNAQMTSRMVRQYCTIDEEGQQLLKNAMDHLGLSARAYDRILKVARTIADLDGSPEIETGHLSEAINFRSLDRDNWGKR